MNTSKTNSAASAKVEMPNFWQMPRAELVHVVQLHHKLMQADKVIQEKNRELLQLKDAQINRLLVELETAPKTPVEIGLVRLARHSQPKYLVQAICRVIELAAFYSDVDIDSNEKEHFLPLLEIRDVFKGESCYSLS